MSFASLGGSNPQTSQFQSRIGQSSRLSMNMFAQDTALKGSQNIPLSHFKAAPVPGRPFQNKRPEVSRMSTVQMGVVEQTEASVALGMPLPPLEESKSN